MNDKVRIFNELVGDGKVGVIWAMENVLGIKANTFIVYCEIIELYDRIMIKHCAK